MEAQCLYWFWFYSLVRFLKGSHIDVLLASNNLDHMAEGECKVFKNRLKILDTLWDSIYFSSSLWVSTSALFTYNPSTIILLNSNLVCASTRLAEKICSK